MRNRELTETRMMQVSVTFSSQSIDPGWWILV